MFSLTGWIRGVHSVPTVPAACRLNGHSARAAWPLNGRSARAAWPLNGHSARAAWPLNGRSARAAWPRGKHTHPLEGACLPRSALVAESKIAGRWAQHAVGWFGCVWFRRDVCVSLSMLFQASRFSASGRKMPLEPRRSEACRSCQPMHVLSFGEGRS